MFSNFLAQWIPALFETTKRGYWKDAYLIDRLDNNARITVDLTDLHRQPFEYAHIGGIETLYHLREFGRQRYWG
ncbi:hypothetical protein [Paraburkholderia sp.]|uniref:hypothetical protein n=1 Tax=Paraburkholderia sp. TaxID=1926495 RepID=UPI003D6FF117